MAVEFDSTTSYSSKKTGTGIISNISDYELVKSGSYGRLLKTYYRRQDTEKNNENSKQENRNLLIMHNDAEYLQRAARELNHDELFAGEYVKGERNRQNYNWQGIEEAVEAFIGSYNSIVEDTQSINSRSVQKRSQFMTETMEKSERLLNKIGITIGEDNKLFLSKINFEQSDMSTVKTLLCGFNSLAGKMQQKAAQLSSYAGNLLNEAVTYTSSGQKDYAAIKRLLDIES